MRISCFVNATHCWVAIVAGGLVAHADRKQEGLEAGK